MRRARLVIVEDEFFAANHLRDLLVELGQDVVGMFDSGEEFLQNTQLEFDAAILDIFLSEKLTGLDIAEELKRKKKPFVFLTANQDKETLTQAARLKPVAYLSKPFKENDVEAALEILNLELGTLIRVTDTYGSRDISSNDILFLKADGNYTKVVTHEKTYTLRSTLREMLDQLPGGFSHIHRSYVVNEIHVTQRSRNQLLIGEHLIPISRSHSK